MGRWRTHQVRPGVWESRSYSSYGMGQLGIVIAILVGGVLLLVVPWQGLLITAGVVAPIGYWHYRYHKSQREERD